MTYVPDLTVEPATDTVDLLFNAGEDVDVEVVVGGMVTGPKGPVWERAPITSAVATIVDQAGAVLHTWSTDAGNLELADQTQPATYGSVLLRTAKAQTGAWWTAWGDAEWRLDVVDLFGRSKVPARGTVRVVRP